MSDHGGNRPPYQCQNCLRTCTSGRGLTQHLNHISNKACSLFYLSRAIKPEEQYSEKPDEDHVTNTGDEAWPGRMCYDEDRDYGNDAFDEIFAAADYQHSDEEEVIAAAKYPTKTTADDESCDDFEEDPGDKEATKMWKQQENVLNRVQRDPSIQPHAIDHSLMRDKEKNDTSGYGQGELQIDFSPYEKAGIQLLKLLQDANVPLYMFDSIINWAKNVQKDEAVDFSDPRISLSRDVLLKRIKLQCGLQSLRSTTIAMKLPGSGTNVSLVVVPFKQALFSMLTCPMCIQDENLVFIQDTPGAFPAIEDDPKILKEMIDGSVYLDAYRRLCTPPDQQPEGHRTDFLVTVPIFIDATHTDQNGNLCVEPVSVSLSLFNKR